MMPMMKFSDQLRPHVTRLGTNEAARLCGVTPRALQLWLNDAGNPNRATQVGAIVILEETETQPKAARSL